MRCLKRPGICFAYNMNIYDWNKNNVYLADHLNSELNSHKNAIYYLTYIWAALK